MAVVSERQPFDPANPFDAVAQATKTAVAHSFNRVFVETAAMDIDRQQHAEAMLTGLMVGACGCAAALTDQEAHGELRAALIGMLPHCFDQAREIAGLPPLGAIS